MKVGKMIESRYPEKVVFEGNEYSVSADFNSDGDIQYFNLHDANGEFVFEIDYEAYSLTEEEIIEILADEFSYQNEEVEASANTESVDAIQDQIEDAHYAEIFASRYPHYADLGDEFRDEAIDVLRRNANESVVFQDVLLDELSEDFEDES